MKYAAILGIIIATYSAIKLAEKQSNEFKKEVVKEVSMKIDRKLRGDTVPCVYSFEVK
jgi:hypothetical protein